MDASGLIALFLVLACGRLSSQMVEDASVDGPAASDETTSSPVPTSTVTSASTTPAPLNCTNGWGIPGACVHRQQCDYGSPAVDRTLYAPRGYVRICKEEEACCPFESIVPVVEPTYKPDDSFDFDEDD